MIFLPFISVSQQLTTENIFYDGNNREYIVYVPQIIHLRFRRQYYLLFMVVLGSLMTL